jgi:glucose/arabinose dehydrogenase
MSFLNGLQRCGLCAVWLVVGADCFADSKIAIRATGTGRLVRDEFPSRFTRTAMVEAPRTVIIDLATNLHVAFDVKTLRTHTAWTGPKPGLPGYQFGQRGSSFATASGPTLWTLRAICPWQTGERSQSPSLETPAGSDFRGLSTKGGQVTLLYDLSANGTATRIHETPRGEFVAGLSTIVRRFEVAPGEQPLWLLAHEESGTLLPLTTNTAVGAIRRQTNLLVGAVRGLEDGFRIQPAEPPKTNTFQLWIKLPVRSEAIAFEIVTAVCANEADARTVATAAASASVAAPRMGFVDGNAPDPVPLTPTFATVAVLAGQPMGDEFFTRESVAVPMELDLLVGGMDWTSEGELAISTWTGEVYLAHRSRDATSNLIWRRFAGGLHEPLGLKVVNGQILVAQKCELTRLVDTDGNGEADLYESVADDWGFNGDMHYFAYGPAADPMGHLYLTLDGNTSDWIPHWELPFRGWTVRLSSDGRQLEGFSSGFRSPNGVFAFGPDGDIFATDNEGYWIGACKLNHCRPGKFFGFPSSTPMPRDVFQKPMGFDPPAVWFPRKLATSASGGTVIPAGCFGPFAGQLLVGDFGTASILRVALERVNGEWQGAVWPFARGFASGVNRLSFGPDGRLYVGGLKRGWPSSGIQDQSLDQLSYRETPFEVLEVHVRKDGFALHFTKPVDPALAGDPQNWDASQFGYKFHSAYGSPEIDHAGKEHSATRLNMESVSVSDDRRQVRLKLSGWKPGYVTSVRSPSLRSADGHKLWHDTFYYTLNQIPK